MGLQPAKTKFRKYQKGRFRGHATRGTTLIFGDFGLQAQEIGFLTTNQIESARKALSHFLKRGGKIWIRILADHIYSSRPAETRMGGGKGAPAGFLARVKPGTILFELSGVQQADAKKAFTLASFKLPITTRMIEK